MNDEPSIGPDEQAERGFQRRPAEVFDLQADPFAIKNLPESGSAPTGPTN